MALGDDRGHPARPSGEAGGRRNPGGPGPDGAARRRLREWVGHRRRRVVGGAVRRSRREPRGRHECHRRRVRAIRHDRGRKRARDIGLTLRDGPWPHRAARSRPDSRRDEPGRDPGRPRDDDLPERLVEVGPPARLYTGTLKRTQIREYSYEDRDAGHYQEDHLIPLSIGGAPRDPANLWPEPLTATLADGTAVGAETKDRFELYLHRAVCDRTVPLGIAQAQMTGDWIAAWEAAGRP